MTHLIVVYGTLKRGYGNWDRLLRDQSFVDEVVSLDNYKLLASGIPFLVPDDAGHPVKGELFCVSDEALRYCDSLEGHPNHYRRETRKFKVLSTGQEVEAGVYLWQGYKYYSEDYLRPIQPNADGVLEWSDLSRYNAPTRSKMPLC